MIFNVKNFYQAFKDNLNETRELKLKQKTYSAVDTRRVFLATDYACSNQSEYFQGESYWSGKEEKGEFLCDYVFQTNKYDVILSLESEWGKKTSKSKTLEEVKYDFIKIINMASPVKIMVFAYVNETNEKEILSMMSEILRNRRIKVSEDILSISCPWYDEFYAETVKGYQWNGIEWKDI